MIDPQPKSIAARRIALIVVAGLAGAGVGLAGVYGIAGLTRNATGPDVVSNGAPETSKSAANNTECLPALERAKAAAPFARGEVAAVNTAKSPLMLPALSFNDASGAHKSLADFRGRVVLLNLWATWCVPCRKEMPALDALQQKMGGPDFQVVAVNIDTRDAEKPKAFLKEIGVSKLAYYADPSARTFQDLKAIGRAFGMPTTLLVDPKGCEIGTIAGPAEWASPDALKLIEAAVKGGKAGS
ncbi:MAG TPA: TlpA disulfide reductase family protein [Pseudolabrys sp.]|nr:TlpA disulfide reductase family protein [Pseudolabrys sp.]